MRFLADRFETSYCDFHHSTFERHVVAGHQVSLIPRMPLPAPHTGGLLELLSLFLCSSVRGTGTVCAASRDPNGWKPRTKPPLAESSPISTMNSRVCVSGNSLASLTESHTGLLASTI